MTIMGAEIGVAGAAVLAIAAVGLAVLGRNRRRERREVENMFAPDPHERAWWDERR